MRTATFRFRLQARAATADALALAGVPVVLCAVYALPEPIKRRLVFDYATPTLLTAYTAHFVHFDPAHLSVNLGSYVLLVPVAYALAALSDELSRFRVAVVTLHTAVPLALSALNLAMVSRWDCSRSRRCSRASTPPRGWRQAGGVAATRRWSSSPR
jgi:hypothetical protein